ncbi:MAG: hypothetical protein V1862_07390 [Methanobacteriota archaeon]
MNIPKLPNHTMQPYSRVYALELQQTDLIIRGKGGRQAEIITPSGARISRVFSCGALTEINKNGKGGGFVRVADPTGVLIIFLKSRMPDILATLDSLTTPAFVSVTANIETDTGSGDSGFRLVLETIQPSDRASRDRWILRTALITLERLRNLASHLSGGQGSEDDRKVVSRYGTSIRQLRVLAGMVEKALTQVQDTTKDRVTSDSETDGESQTNYATDLVIKLIRQHSGPRGVSVQELTSFAQKAGIAEPLLIDTIRALVGEDEIYQPSTGFVKIL